MPRRRKTKQPESFDLTGLLTADQLRWHITSQPTYAKLTDAELAAELGLSAGFIGMIRSGSRSPSKAFLNAIGAESVTLYRLKGLEGSHQMQRRRDLRLGKVCGPES